MNVKVTYPPVPRGKLQRKDVIRLARWPFGLAALVTVFVNLATGGPAWSLIALWSYAMIWSFAIAPDLVEYNRISQWIRLITCACLLLFMIDWLFPTGWSIRVVPIVCFSGLIVAGVLFFTDLRASGKTCCPCCC